MKITSTLKHKRLSLPIASFLVSSAYLGATRVYAQPSCQSVGDSADLKDCVQDNPIVKDLNIIINGLSIGVGLIITASLIVAGIQYMTGGQNSQQVTDAKKRISNSLIALITFLLTVAFLQWVVPGGIFN